MAKVSFGDVRSCSGALINARWIVTAKDCFADSSGNVAAGVPTQSTTVVLGRANITTDAGHKLVVTSIVPHPDRNIVLAELSAAVKDIAPIPISGSAPQADETLKVAGYGRTANEWVPDRMHAATFSVSGVTASQFEVLGSATLCRGDAGGPAFRETSGGSVDLVGISDSSWQKGCIGETETRDGAYEARVDDLKDWITQSIAVQPSDLKEPVLGEFTRDGFQDLIGIDSLGNGWLFPSTSASTWGNPVRLSSTWSGYRELTIARVNRDSYDDMLIINASGALVVYYGAAGGLFSSAATLSTAFSGYRDLAVGNINNIGYDTLFAIDSSTGIWYYFAGLAAGGFNMTRVQTGSGWTCCRQNTFGYFNNDSYLDLATIETSTGKLRIYPGTSANGLGTGAVDEGAGATWGSATYIAAGKFDSTGLTGLLEVDSAGKLWLHARTAGGGWAAKTALPGRSWGVLPGDMVQLVSGEFNRDGHPDLFGIDASGSGWLFRSTSATTWAFGARQSSTWGGWRDMVVGRVNRDDYDDLLMITSAGALVQYNGVAAGGITPVGTINSSFSDYRDLSIAKINNFAYDTLFGIKNSTGQWFYFPAVAAGGFNLTAPVQTGSGWGCCKLNTFGKFNDDDYVDLATVEVSTGKLRVYPGTSSNGLGTGAVDENAGAAWLSQDVAAIHSEVTGRDSILAKALPTGNLNLYPSIPNGIDWADPIVYGTRY